MKIFKLLPVFKPRWSNLATRWSKFVTSTMYLIALPLLLHAQKTQLIVRQETHQDKITGISFSPEEDLAATIGKDKQLFLWDLKRGKFIKKVQIPEIPQEVWFKDSITVGVLDEKNQVQIWDLNTWTLKKTIKMAEKELKGYSFSLDYSLMVTYSKDNWLSVWDLRKGELLWQKKQGSNIPILHFTRDASMVVLRSKNGEVQYAFSTQTGEEATLEVDFFQLGHPADSMDASLMDRAIYGNDKQVTFVDFRQEVYHTVSNENSKKDGPLPFVFSKDKTTLIVLWETLETAMATSPGSIQHNYESITTIYDLSKHNAQSKNTLAVKIGAVQTNSSGTQILYTDERQRLYYSSEKDLQDLHWSVQLPERTLRRVVFSDDLEQADLVRFRNWNSMILDFKGGGLMRLAEERESFDPSVFASSPDGKMTLWHSTMYYGNAPIALMDSNGDYIDPYHPITHLNIANGQGRSFSLGASAFQFTPDERVAVVKWYTTSDVTSYTDGRYRSNQQDIWCKSDQFGPYELGVLDLENETYDKLESGSEDPLDPIFLRASTGVDRFLALHVEKEKILAISKDQESKNIRLWDLSSGKQLFEKQWPGEMTAVCILPDGKTALSSFKDGNLWLWDVQTGKVLRELGNLGTYYHLEVTSDTRWAILRRHGQAAVVDLKNDKLVFKTGDQRPENTTIDGNAWDLSRKMGEVSDLRIDQHKQLAMVGHFDGVIRIWDLQTGKELAGLYPVGNQGEWVMLTPSGLYDATPGAEAKVYISTGRKIIEPDNIKDHFREKGLLQQILAGEDLRKM